MEEEKSEVPQPYSTSKPEFTINATDTHQVNVLRNFMKTKFSVDPVYDSVLYSPLNKVKQALESESDRTLSYV